MTERDDGLDAAQGLVYGFAYGCALWILIGIVLLAGWWLANIFIH